MPYTVTTSHPDCSGFGVTKDDDGALMGCHPTQAEANEQMAALYAAETVHEIDDQLDDMADWQEKHQEIHDRAVRTPR